MKTYKINYAEPVNTHCSKNGIKWRYGGKKTNLEEIIKEFEDSIEWRSSMKAKGYSITFGMRITDTETNEIIYERMI